MQMNKVAVIVSVISLVLQYLITVVSVIISYLVATGGSFSAIYGLGVTNIVLPICLGIVLTFDGGYLPSQKLATIIWAKESIQTEWYRFRTRTGAYQMIYGMSPGQNRVNFAATLDAIVATLKDLEFAAVLPDLEGI